MMVPRPRVPGVLVLVLFASTAASAQTTPAPADITTPSQPIVEKIETGWVFGGGPATMPRPLGEVVNLDALNRRGPRHIRFGQIDPATPVGVNDDFEVVEPQVDLLRNVSPRWRINFGVGSRMVGWAPYLGDQLRGASGSIALQVGGGS